MVGMARIGERRKAVRITALSYSADPVSRTAMRPSILQYLVARWLVPMWFLVWTGTGVAWGAIVSLPFLLTPLFIPFGVIYCALAGALGFFVGVFIGAFVLPPICCWRSWVNGAPFRAGDRVRILDGPYRDEV